MRPISFRLRGWESWPSGHKAEKAGLIPTLLRRRVTSVGQQALSSAWHLPETAHARLILSSRHGECSRTASLLESAISKSDLSPADFTLSVHHALLGLLSIAHKNNRGHTAVASGQESFCYGLLEAAACAKEMPDELIVLVHFDDLLPPPFSMFNEPAEQPIALALALAATGEGVPLQFTSECSSTGNAPSVSHAQDFLNFINDGLPECVSVGEHRKWRWTRYALD